MNSPNDSHCLAYDADSDGIPDVNDPDDDNDGLPDEFEENKSNTCPCRSDSNGNNILDGDEDPDEDGFPTIMEYQGNSNPLDGNSLPEGMLSWDVPLSIGWNAVGLALDVSYLKAHNACEQIGTHNVSVKELDMFTDGTWAGHICGLPFNDFTFSPGRGYFILAAENILWTQIGFDILSPLIMNIKPGWNVISLPRWAEDFFTAQGFLNEIKKQGGACTEIDRFTEGGAWETYIDGIPMNDFTLMPGKGYTLKCEKPSQISISCDRDPPIMSDITITPTTSGALSEASITWTTNEPASTEIHYGTTPNYGFIFTDPALVLSHSRILTDLYPGTTFHIKIISRDDSNNTAVSEDHTFSTPDAPLPIAASMMIYQNEVSPTPDYDGTDDAVISGLPHWDQNANTGAWEHLTTYADSLGKSKTLIRFELKDIPLGAPILYASLSLRHFLGSESPQEVTAYRITKGWVEGTGWRISPQEPIDGVSWVKTGPGIPWEDEGGDVDQVTDFGLGPNGLVSSHTVEPLKIPENWEDWDITPLVQGWVNGKSPNNGLMLLSSGEEGIAHRYRSRNYTAHPESRPRLIVFYGEEPQISPAENLNARGEEDSIYLTWTNPPDKMWSGTRIVRSTCYYPLHENDGAVIYDGIGESYNDTNVVSRQMNYYTAFAHDAQGNFSLPLPTSQNKAMIYRPIGQPGNFKAVPGNKEISLSWQNPSNDPYWTRTIIKRSIDSFPQKVSDGVLVYEGTGQTHTDQNLGNGKAFYYSAFACDSEGNCSGPVHAEASLHVPPVKDFHAACAEGNIILTWQNIANVPYWEGIRILRSQAGCTENPEDEDGIIIYEGGGNSYADTDVTQGQTYHYCAFNFDDDGVFSQVSYTTASLTIPIQPMNINALHRSGQTFITWEEVNAYYGEQCRVYRHTAPITAGNLQQAQLLATVREGSSSHLIEQAHPDPFQSHFIIEDLGPELSNTTGLFVNTIHESGRFYYAVTTIFEGSENTNEFTANNSLLDGIVEQQAAPRPVVAWESDSGHGRVYTQFMDYHDWNFEYDGYAYNYSVSVPEDYNPNRAYPIVLNLEEYGSRYTRHEKAPYNLRAIYIQVDDPVMDNLVMPREATWYFGYKDSTGNRIKNFSEERILRIIHDLIADPYYNVDENRICARGYGMGGNGALSLGMRYPNIFSLILVGRPITNFVATSTSGGKNWVPVLEPLWGTVQENLPILIKGYYTEDLQVYNGEGVWDWQNHQQHLNQHRGLEMAYIGAVHRINDEQIDVQTQAYPFYDTLDFTNRGYMGHIYEQGSREGRFLLHPNLNLLGFHKGYSFPAFSALSLIFIPASGLVEYNLDLEWSCPWQDFSGGLPDGGIIDTPDTYEVIVRSTSEEKMMNITPRRCKQFVLTPGESCSWLNIRRNDGQILQGGLGMADNHGLITLVGVRITTGQGNLIRISSQVATSYSGDIQIFNADPGDGHVKLSWQNPDSDGWIGTLILRSKDGFPPNPYLGNMVYQGMDDFYIDEGLDNGTTYYYAVFTFNQSFEYSKIPATDSATPNSQAGSPPLIIDHTCTDLSMIPSEWVNVAKNNLRVLYGHTLYGSQIISGMQAMATDLYSFTIGSQIVPDSISIQEVNEDLGTGGDLTWQAMTLAQLQNQNNNRNIIIWAWGDGVSNSTEEEINIYLQAMSQLELSYPGITFVYMTAHLDGTGEEGNLFNRNNQIRDYCLRNGKVLFDFADIESYDPAGDYYLRLGADEGCYYNNGKQNWAKEWCAQNSGHCSSYYCAHSHPLNCDLKAGAFWWMMARIAGWDPSTTTSLTSLRVSHKKFSFDATGDGSNPPSQLFMINCRGNQTVNYTIDDDAPWLHVSPTNGILSNKDQPITASVDVTGLKEDIYTGTITINAQGAENSPATVTVTLTIAVAGEDTIPPAISDIIVVPSSTGVVIHWKTGEPGDSQIHYGLTADYSASTSLDSNKVLWHSQSISGLLPETTYHFQIDSSDSSLNKGVSTDFTFATGDRPFSQVTTHLQHGVNGYTGGKDTFITPYWDGDDNLGGNDYLECHKQETERGSILIHFDTNGIIPEGVSISEARLELYNFNYNEPWDEDFQEISAYRMTADWIEGTGTKDTIFEDPPDQTGAYWTHSGYSPWTGGEFDSTLLDRVMLPGRPGTSSADDGWVSWDITEAVQAWHEGSAENYGAILRGDANGEWTGHYFRSNEYAVPEYRPRLVITHGLRFLMSDPLHLIYDSSSTSSAEEIFIDPDRLWRDIDIEPDNPGYPDLVLSNATLQEGHRVDIDSRRVSGGASFTINVFVLVDMSHAEEGRDVDRDLIGVRLTGSPETIPDDDLGLVTSINLTRGYDNRMLLDGGSAILDMVGTDEVLVFDFSMAEFLERPEDYEGPTIDMDAAVALEDISPLFDWEVYQFEIDSSDLYPGRWRFIAEVDPDDVITEYYETANNSLDISAITLGDPPVITLFEFEDQPDPLRASICSGQRVIVHYAIDSEFPVTARIIYEGHTMDLRDPSEGTVRIGPNYGPKRFTDRITLEAIGPGGTDERTLEVYYDRDGVDFSDIPWAQNWIESKERLHLRQRAVMEYWSRKDFYPWELDPAAPESAWGRATDSIGVCIAYLWRAYNDPTLSAGDRSAYIQMVNHYLNSTGIFAIAHYPELEATEIGTCNQSMKRADIGGEDYDFRLRLFTLLTYLFKDEYNDEIGHALTDESKRKLMSELLTVDGDNHHTIIETESGLEDKLYDLLTGPWEDIPESLHDKAEDCRTYGEYFCMNGVHLPTFEKDGIRDIIEGLLEETENHILMSETSRYLKNQLITSIEDQGYTDKASHEYDDNEYNNQESGFNDWIRRHLKGFIVSGFNEYNSNTYSGYSISALSNLYDFAQDPQVKKAARIVLDFHAARFATQSFDLKQCVGFNRKPKYLKRPELWLGPMTSWYAVLIGNYAGLQEDYDGIWQWRTQHMFPVAATSYTVPDLILDLAIDKSHNPYEIRVNHTPPNYFDPSRTVQRFPHSENIEVLSARRGYLLTAGGRFSEADYWYTELLSQFAGGVSEEDEEDEGAGEHHGWPHPTTLIVRNGQRIHEPLAPTGLPRCDPSRLEPGDPDDYLIYSWGTYIHDENRNNTAVWRNFAAGTAGFHIPCNYRHDVVYGENLWRFYRLSDPGLYVAIHHSSGILEVVDDTLHGGPTFEAFRSNAERQRIRFGNGTYETIDGHQITYNVNLSEGEPPGRWPISHINGEAQEQDYHDWPFIESIDDPNEGLNRVLWADGYGLAIVNNPYMNQSLILSLVDWRHPIRISQACTAEDITTGASVEASARASSAHNAIDDDPATNWPIWGSTESSLTIDFGSPQTFKFISIRYSSSSGYSRIDEITIETSSNGTDFTPILTRDVHPWLRKGIDIEIPQQTARYVRLRFNCDGIEVRINEIEIYRYAPLFSIVSPESRRNLDPYEINDTVSQAMPIVPGVLSDPLIHGLDDIDYFEVDLLAGNTIQAQIEYDLTMSLNIELWGISSGTPDPVLLASGTGEEIDGDNIKRYAEWTADSSPWQCYIRIAPETGIIGNYTLTIQTRGPELEPDFREDMEVVWEFPVHLSPEPDPDTGIPIAELFGRNIHTGGPWNTWRPYWGEADYFSVIGQRGYDVRVTITPTDPDAGQPHAFPREDPRISRFIDNRSDWPDTQVLIIRPTYGDAPSMRVCFGVKGSHNDNYRKDTGDYDLKVELTYAISDIAVIEDFYSATDTLEDDLAEYFELPEISLMLELGVNYEFEAPPRPGDPYLMHIQSKTTGETIYSYELDSSLFSSPEEFTEAADYFMEIHSPVFELSIPGQ